MDATTGRRSVSRHRFWLAGVLASALVLATALPVWGARARTVLISKTSAGEPATDADSNNPSVSASGRYVAFDSRADNLPGGNVNDQVYVHDRKTEKTRFVGKTSAGEPAVNCSRPAISASGRFVVFQSNAQNLPGDDTTTDVFIRDRKTGKTRLISKTSGADPADGDSHNASISASGRYVAFDSDAANLPGGASPFPLIYVHDRKTGKTRLASKTSDGVPAEGGQSVGPLISARGRHIGFESNATNLGGDNAYTDTFVHDRKSGRTRLISRNSAGEPATGGDSYGGWLSASGRYVGFESGATNLPGDASLFDVYIRDLKTGKTRLVSKTSDGSPATGGGSSHAQLSASGRYVAFFSGATNLPGDDGWRDVYVRDLKTGKTKLMSKTSGGQPATGGDSFRPALAASGRVVAFPSEATNLPGAAGFMQIYARGPLH